MNVVTKNKFTQFLQNSRINLVIAVAVAIVVVGIGYFFVRSYAGSAFASVEVDQGTTSGNASLVSDSTASGGKAVQFNAPAQTGGGGGTTATTCPLPDYPSPSCTGVPAGTKFTKTVNGNYTASTNGEVIDSWHITGDLIISASNVQIKNTQIDGAIANEGPSGGEYKSASFAVTDTTIGTTTCNTDGQPSINGHDFTATRVHLQGHADGIDVVGSNVTVQDSYIRPCYLPPSVVGSDGYHSDSIQDQCNTHITSYCSHITLIHSTWDSNIDNGNSAANLGSGPDGFALADVTLRDNLFLGGGYTTDLHWDTNGDNANWVVTNNAWANKVWAYGPISTESTCSHQTWSGNKLVTVDGNFKLTSTVSSQACVD